MANFSVLNGLKLDREILEKCAQLYCEIWKEAPWNEDFWKPEAVARDMAIQFAKPGARAFIAFERKTGVVVGFTWGYNVRKSEMEEISNTSWSDLAPNYFYLDEMGVHKDFRRMGLGSVLSAYIISGVKIADVIVRTNEKATAAIGLYQKLGFRSLGISDGNFPDRIYLKLER